MNTSWFIKPETNPKRRFGHNAVMPIKLAEKVIKYWTRPGEVVLDPFAGIGTTLYAAMKWSRKAWGIEISEQYCEIIRKRLQSIPQPLDQFLETSEKISKNENTKGGKNTANRTKL
jgi:site-specific DNA-methyltransferase (adenine-specific)